MISVVLPGTYTACTNEGGVTGGGRFVTAPVTVSANDSEGLQLTLGSGAEARGRIVFEFDARGISLPICSRRSPYPGIQPRADRSPD